MMLTLKQLCISQILSNVTSGDAFDLPIPVLLQQEINFQSKTIVDDQNTNLFISYDISVEETDLSNVSPDNILHHVDDFTINLKTVCPKLDKITVSLTPDDEITGIEFVSSHVLDFSDIANELYLLGFRSNFVISIYCMMLVHRHDVIDDDHTGSLLFMFSSQSLQKLRYQLFVNMYLSNFDRYAEGVPNVQCRIITDDAENLFNELVLSELA